jgi:hypothetical protein
MSTEDHRVDPDSVARFGFWLTVVAALPAFLVTGRGSLSQFFLDVAGVTWADLGQMESVALGLLTIVVSVFMLTMIGLLGRFVVSVLAKVYNRHLA